jgi:hypothetical protein
MKRALLLSIAAIGAFGAAAHALASVSATGVASVTIQQAAGINVVSPLVLPTVSTTPVVNTPVSTTAPVTSSASASTAGSPVSNAALTIYGQSGDAVSMAVPETFKVVRTGGTESLTVKTNTDMEYDVSGNGVILGGGATADTMSVNVGGALTLASAEPLVPGPYQGMLVVVVQYN